jgi:hypothetical protein
MVGHTGTIPSRDRRMWQPFPRTLEATGAAQGTHAACLVLYQHLLCLSWQGNPLFRHLALCHSSPRTRCIAVSPPAPIVCPPTAPASPFHTARARGRLAYLKRCAGRRGLWDTTTNAHGGCCATRDATRTRVRACAQADRLLLRNLERSTRRIPGLILTPQKCR